MHKASAVQWQRNAGPAAHRQVARCQHVATNLGLRLNRCADSSKLLRMDEMIEMLSSLFRSSMQRQHLIMHAKCNRHLQAPTCCWCSAGTPMQTQASGGTRPAAWLASLCSAHCTAAGGGHALLPSAACWCPVGAMRVPASISSTMPRSPAASQDEIDAQHVCIQLHAALQCSSHALQSVPAQAPGPAGAVLPTRSVAGLLLLPAAPCACSHLAPHAHRNRSYMRRNS